MVSVLNFNLTLKSLAVVFPGVELKGPETDTSLFKDQSLVELRIVLGFTFSFFLAFGGETFALCVCMNLDILSWVVSVFPVNAFFVFPVQSVARIFLPSC